MKPLLALLIVFSALSCAIGQSDPLTAIATPPGGNYYPVRFGQVNLDTGNLSLAIPLARFDNARGVPATTLQLTYNSTIWGAVQNGTGYYVSPTNGWSTETKVPYQMMVYPTDTEVQSCGANHTGSILKSSRFSGSDDNGVVHEFLISPVYLVNCYGPGGAPYTPGGNYPTAGSGPELGGGPYYLNVSDYYQHTVYRPDGTTTTETPNGNLIQLSAPGVTYQNTDDTGRITSIGTTLSCSADDYTTNVPYTAKTPNVCQFSLPARDGSSSSVVYSTTSIFIPVCTNFAQTLSSVGDYCGGIWVVGSVNLPDGSVYQFQYDQGQTPGHYGQLTGITLATGGQIAYSYTGANFNQPYYGLHLTSVSDNGGISTIAYTVPPPVGSRNVTQQVFPLYPITVTYPVHQKTPSSSPASDQTVYTGAASNSAITLTKQDFDGSTLVLQTDRDYLNPATPRFSQITWPQTGQTDRFDYTYTSYPTASIVQDKVETLNGSTLRSTHIDFLQDTSNTAYVSQYHMSSYPIRVQDKDGSGNVVAETDYSYDEYGQSWCSQGPAGASGIATLSLVSGSYGHDDTHDQSYYARGNPTTISQLGGGVALSVQHRCYDTLGNVTETVDGNGQPTQIRYDDNFVDSVCAAPGGAHSHGLPTSIITPLGQTSTVRYNSCSRAARFESDPNDVAAGRSGTESTFDATGRPLCNNATDGGQACRSYSSANSYTDSQVITATTTPHTVSTSLNAYGEISSRVDQQANTEIDYTYDALGRLSSESVPHAPCGGYCFEPTAVHFYEGLGRPSALLTSDGSSMHQWVYSGPNTDVYDEAGAHRRLQYNAAGQLSSVLEYGSSTFTTAYQYDSQGNLLTVTQNGGTGDTARPRSFTYDSLSRLQSAYTPETGSICYGVMTGATCHASYDANGNLLSKTDARGRVTTFTYDAQNRLTDKAFYDGTPGLHFRYDQTSGWMGTQYNTVGRLSQIFTDWDMRYYGTGTAPACNPQTSTTANYNPANGNPTYCQWTESRYSYDPMGRVITTGFAPPSVAGWSSHISGAAYDLAGNLTDLTYPDGRHVKQSFDGAGRLIASNLVDIYGAAASQNYVQNITYLPDGSPSALTLDNGLITQTIGKNSRSQVQSISVAGSSSTNPLNGRTFLSHTYSYANPSAMGNNGNIYGITDTLNGVNSQAFSYDSLNRISGFSAGGSVNQQYWLDAFGNMTQLANGNPVASFDAQTNRVSNLSCASATSPYDSAGNQTCSTDQYGGIKRYTYDAESRLSRINALTDNSPFATYSYDANGVRIRKSDIPDATFTEYMNFAGLPIAEKDQTGAWKDYIFANGQRVASVGQDVRLVVQGTNCSNCGWQYTVVPTPDSAQGHVIQSGDYLAVTQFAQAGTVAGIGVTFTDGTYSDELQLADQDGQPMTSDGTSGQWHSRLFDLSSQQGKTVALTYFITNGGTQGGDWSVAYRDAALFGIDGTVISLFRGESGLAPSTVTSGVSSLSVLTQTQGPYPGDIPLTHFYTADHLGSASLELTSGAYPVVASHFLPFGGEVNTQSIANHYKFTGKERDTESGLDYFGARYYSSAMGRWTSPDPSVLDFADLTNPQSLNLYSYVLNNPLKFTDIDGLVCHWDDSTQDDSPSDGGASFGDCATQGGSWSEDVSINVTADNKGNQLDVTTTDSNGSFIDFLPGAGCSAALKTAQTNGQAMVRYYQQYQSLITDVANSNNIDPSLLGAVGIRETGLRNIAQSGGGMGRGVFQVDLGAHPNVTSAQAFNVYTNANIAANMLAAGTANLEDQGYGAQMSIAGSVRQYNAGTRYLKSKMKQGMAGLNRGTTGGNYVSNVLALQSQCF